MRTGNTLGNLINLQGLKDLVGLNKTFVLYTYILKRNRQKRPTRLIETLQIVQSF